MKKTLLLLIAIVCSVCIYGQSSVVQMGEAVIRCDNFTFAKTMLLNERFSVDKTSKRNSVNCVVLTNAPTDNLHFITVELRKQAKSKKIKNVIFTFHSSGKYSKNIAMELINWNYKVDKSEGTGFREFWSNGNKHIGIDINSRGWMVATCYKK